MTLSQLHSLCDKDTIADLTDVRDVLSGTFATSLATSRDALLFRRIRASSLRTDFSEAECINSLPLLVLAVLQLATVTKSTGTIMPDL